MNKFAAKAKVVLTALPTIMTAVAAGITAAAPLIARVFPDNAEAIARVAVVVVGVLGAAVVVIRNVTRVDADQVGILPQGPPSSPVVVIDQTPPVDVPGGQ